jgi:hypothetical protein
MRIVGTAVGFCPEHRAQGSAHRRARQFMAHQPVPRLATGCSPAGHPPPPSGRTCAVAVETFAVASTPALGSPPPAARRRLPASRLPSLVAPAARSGAFTALIAARARTYRRRPDRVALVEKTAARPGTGDDRAAGRPRI